MKARWVGIAIGCATAMLTAPARGDLFVAGWQLSTPTIFRYDEVTGSYLGSFYAGGEVPVSGIAVGPDHRLYSAFEGASGAGIYRATGPAKGYIVQATPNPSPFGLPIPNNGLSTPKGMVFGADGNMYVLSNFNSFYGSLSTSGVLKYRTDGTFRGKFANTGGDYLRFGPNGDLFVTVSGRIDRYRGSDGTFVGTFVSSGGAAAFGPDGKLYVSSSNNRVLRYDGTTGAFIDTFVASGSGGLNGPSDLAFGPDGDLYVCSSNYPLGSSASVLRYSGTTGSFIDAFVPSSLPNKMYVTSFMTFGDIPEPSSLVLLIFFTATVTRRPMHIQPA